ncbi:hypothetical protein GGF31_000127 [Allomyces arbusculus]|nr:hypothetical protein GGF31_000127 [Allomyces arbusculus]
MSVVTIPKVGVSEQLNDGKIFLAVFAVGLFVHLVSFLYLVSFQRKHRLVVTSNPSWLLLTTLAIGSMHAWSMLWTAAPSSTICTAQLATGLAWGAFFVISVATKALHYQFIHGSAVLSDAFGSSTNSHRMIPTVFGAVLALIEAGIAKGRAKKLTSIRRKSVAPGRAWSEHQIGIREGVEERLN